MVTELKRFFLQNLWTPIVTKLKNSNCDKTIKKIVTQKSKNQIVTKLKTQIVTRLKNSNFNKTQKL